MPDIEITIDPKEESEKVIHLNIRKTLAGDIIIRDHPDIDITILSSKKKIIAFPKEEMRDEVYQTQDKFFNFLNKRGTIDPDSIQGGNVFGSMEAKYLADTEANPLKLIILVIANFIEEERPIFEFLNALEDYEEDRMTEPSEAESSEYDPSRHAATKGALRPIYIRSPYGINYGYLMENEE